MTKRGLSIEQRFWSKVKKTSSCWIWTASTNDKGYPLFGINGKTRQAYKISFEWTNGPVPKGKEIDHLCRNRLCVNPDHLEAVSHKVNLLRGNGWGARNKRKTQCPQGHPLEEANLVKFQFKKGIRICLTCQRERMRVWIRKTWRENPDQLRNNTRAWKARHNT